MGVLCAFLPGNGINNLSPDGDEKEPVLKRLQKRQVTPVLPNLPNCRYRVTVLRLR